MLEREVERLIADATARGRAEALREVAALTPERDAILHAEIRAARDAEFVGWIDSELALAADSYGPGRVERALGRLRARLAAPPAPSVVGVGEREAALERARMKWRSTTLEAIIKSLDELRIDLQSEREVRCDELDDAIVALRALAAPAPADRTLVEHEVRQAFAREIKPLVEHLRRFVGVVGEDDSCDAVDALWSAVLAALPASPASAPPAPTTGVGEKGGGR